MSRRGAAVVLIVALAVPAALAQVKEAITVQFVEVPVTVVDKEGNPIRGLKAENFEVLDEGKKRDISAFDAIDFKSVPSVAAISPLNPVARRNFMLLFDLSYSSPQSIKRSQEAAAKFLDDMVEPRDRIAVATIDADKGFRLLSAFTTDRALVKAAIANPSSFRGNDPLQIAGLFPVKEEKTETGGGSETAGIAQAEMNELIQRGTRAEDQYNRQKIDRQVNLLTGLARTLRSVRGPKHVVFLSEGFDPRLIQGRSAGSSQEQQQEAMAVETGEVWRVDTDNRYGSASSLSILDKMAQMFRRSDVFLHAIDIAGLRVDNDAQSGARKKSNEGLFLLANSTGGTVFRNTNDLAADFDRFAKQQEVVYILGFQAPVSQAGKFHGLKVRLVNVPGGRVVHRSGYYEAGGETVAERSLTTAEIILNDIPQDAVRVAALTASFPTPGPNAQVPVILEIRGEDIVRAAAGKNPMTEIFVYAFDEQGLVRDTLVQRMTLDMQKVGEQMRSGGVKYYGTLSLPPGKYAIKSLVRVGEGQNGFARSDLVVPAAGEMAISQPFFIEAPGKWVMVKGASHDTTNSGYPFEVNGETFIPAARLPNGQPRRFAVFVYNASPEELTWDVAPAAKLVAQVKSARGAKFVFELDPAAAAPALNVTLTKKGTGEARKSSVPIVVQ